MTRPPSLSKPSAAAVRRRNNRVNTVLFKRKLVKGWLRSAGRKHAITMKAFRTVTTMGQQLFDRLVNTVVCELSRNIKNNKTTIKTRHIIHSANILNTSSELVEAALEMKKSKRYVRYLFWPYAFCFVSSSADSINPRALRTSRHSRSLPCGAPLRDCAPSTG